MLGHIEPIVRPVREMVDERVDVDFLVPVAVAPAARVVDGDLRDPVDGREARVGICGRDRVEHDAVTVRAEADERGAACGSALRASCRAT